MVDIEIVREWIEKAEEDFQFALANLQERNSFFAQICFHFQQSAEKDQKEGIMAIALILSNDSVYSEGSACPALPCLAPLALLNA
jgi:HEPN domain-containing protein